MRSNKERPRWTGATRDRFPRCFVATIVTVLVATIVDSGLMHWASYCRDVMREKDAKVVRKAMDAYAVDNGHAPKSPDDLVTSGYLKPQDLPVEIDPPTLEH
jgi:hypothetical protein